MVGTYDNIEKFYKEGADMNGEPMIRAQVRLEGIENNITRNRNINIGLFRGENPTRLQGLWINEEFRQNVEIA